MNRKTFEQQKAFAGERVPSMKRRCIDHDYTERRMYMVTLVVEGRHKLFGEVKGRSDAPKGSAEAPWMELSALGEAVQHIWLTIADYHPEVKVLALQMMPDHLHCILYVQRKLEKSLGSIILGVKQACNQAYRKIVRYVAVTRQHTEQQHTQQQPQRHTGHERGLLFERGYNDRILLHDGQLQRWLDYLADNPRRLLAKREHPDLFRVQFGLEYAGQTFAAIGNRFLLDRPMKIQVQCSRSLTKEQIQDTVEHYLVAARQGAVSFFNTNNASAYMRGQFSAPTMPPHICAVIFQPEKFVPHRCAVILTISFINSILSTQYTLQPRYCQRHLLLFLLHIISNKTDNHL
ncbi:MAG: hypothetical protein J6X58_07600 [Bacteroidales bacterium]|nr:hypothetical protein [Bacteroidales bacterium]